MPTSQKAGALQEIGQQTHSSTKPVSSRYGPHVGLPADSTEFETRNESDLICTIYHTAIASELE